METTVLAGCSSLGNALWHCLTMARSTSVTGAAVTTSVGVLGWHLAFQVDCHCYSQSLTWPAVARACPRSGKGSRVMSLHRVTLSRSMVTRRQGLGSSVMLCRALAGSRGRNWQQHHRVRLSQTQRGGQKQALALGYRAHRLRQVLPMPLSTPPNGLSCCQTD